MGFLQAGVQRVVPAKAEVPFRETAFLSLKNYRNLGDKSMILLIHGGADPLN
jgi:hypothetical protein